MFVYNLRIIFFLRLNAREHADAARSVNVWNVRRQSSLIKRYKAHEIPGPPETCWQARIKL